VSLPLRYAPWQLRDFVVARLPQLLVIGGLLGAQLLLPLRLAAGAAWTSSPAVLPAVDAAERGLTALIPMALTIFAVQGMVSADRRSGHYRLLFSKPVSVAGFYAQRWLVDLVGVLLGATLLVAAHGLLVRPVSPLPFLGTALLVYLVVGSLGLFLSALTRLDWIVLVLLWAAASLLQDPWLAAGGWRGAVAMVLPPATALAELRTALQDGLTPAARPLAWALGYATICFALAMAALKRRPLGA
jgi:hypothetical protein